jgi:hypothetical protein
VVVNDKYNYEILGRYRESERAELELQSIYTAYAQGKNTYTMGVEE